MKGRVIDPDVALVEKQVKAERRRLNANLVERQAEKRRIEKRIKKYIGEPPLLSKPGPNCVYVSFERVKRPYVIVEIVVRLEGCLIVRSLAIVRCWEEKDKWSKKKGLRIAKKRARRNAARILAGLET